MNDMASPDGEAQMDDTLLYLIQMCLPSLSHSKCAVVDLNLE